MGKQEAKTFYSYFLVSCLSKCAVFESFLRTDKSLPYDIIFKMTQHLWLDVVITGDDVHIMHPASGKATT